MDGGQFARIGRVCRLQEDLRLGAAVAGLALPLVQGYGARGMSTANADCLSDWPRQAVRGAAHQRAFN